MSQATRIQLRANESFVHSIGSRGQVLKTIHIAERYFGSSICKRAVVAADEYNTDLDDTLTVKQTEYLCSSCAALRSTDTTRKVKRWQAGNDTETIVFIDADGDIMQVITVVGAKDSSDALTIASHEMKMFLADYLNVNDEETEAVDDAFCPLTVEFLKNPVTLTVRK